MKKMVPLILALGLFGSCVPEDLAKNVCPAIGGVNTLTLKVTSTEPFPENYGVSLNRGELSVYEGCASSIGTNILFDESRTTLRAVFSLPTNDSVYFPAYSEAPQSEYMDVSLERKENCATDAVEDHFKSNVVITWLKASKFSAACKTNNFHGTSEFRYNP